MTKSLQICPRCKIEHIGEIKTCPKCIEYQRKWKNAHKDITRKQQQEHHQRNKEQINERHRKRYQENNEEIRSKQRERYRTDEELRKKKAIYAKTPKVKAKVSEYSRNRYAIDPEFRKHRSEQQKKREAARKFRVFKHYSNGEPQCECCGETEIIFLSIDHINGRGNETKRVTGQHIYQMLEREGFPDGYRILCHNCNQAFGILGYCPHQQNKE